MTTKSSSFYHLCRYCRYCILELQKRSRYNFTLNYLKNSRSICTELEFPKLEFCVKKLRTRVPLKKKKKAV